MAKEETNETTTNEPSKADLKGYVKAEAVEQMIKDAIEKFNAPKPINPKKVLNHTPHLWRINGKWVVDFVDRNNDPYIQGNIFSFNKYNTETRENEPWVELKYNDGKTEEIKLRNYVQNRLPIYCEVVDKQIIDQTQTFGTVEKKEWKGDKQVGTGVEVAQFVEKHMTIYKLKTPDGEILENIPDYVLA